MSDGEEEVVGQLPTVSVPRHIKKRSLRNKALSVAFNDKDLRDFVTGFHKRKKKRRREAQVQIQHKDRIRRIQARKQRKQEREFALYGEVPPEDKQGSDSGPCEETLNLNPSVSGTKLYEHNDTTITVTTMELSRDNDDVPVIHSVAKSSAKAGTSHSLQVKKKPLKQAAKHKSRRKATKSKKEKRQGSSQKEERKKGRKKRCVLGCYRRATITQWMNETLITLVPKQAENHSGKIEVVVHLNQIHKLMMACISTVRYRVIVNEALTNLLSPSCGIRQGDPLSPYIFVLCMDKLSRMIEDMVSKKTWKPV